MLELPCCAMGTTHATGAAAGATMQCLGTALAETHAQIHVQARAQGQAQAQTQTQARARVQAQAQAQRMPLLLPFLVSGVAKLLAKLDGLLAASAPGRVAPDNTQGGGGDPDSDAVAWRGHAGAGAAAWSPPVAWTRELASEARRSVVVATAAGRALQPVALHTLMLALVPVTACAPLPLRHALAAATDAAAAAAAAAAGAAAAASQMSTSSATSTGASTSAHESAESAALASDLSRAAAAAGAAHAATLPATSAADIASALALASAARAMMWDHDGRALCLVTRALLGPHMLLPAAVAPWTWPWVHTGGSQLAAVHNGDGSGSMYASVYGMLGFDASAAEHELRLHLRSTVFARTSECVRAVAAHFAGAPPDARLRTVAQWRLWAAALHWQLGIVDRNARVMEYFLSVSPGQGHM